MTDERKMPKTQEELERLASFQLLSPNPVIEVDSSGRITFYNPSAEKVLESLGLTKRDVALFLPSDIHVILKDLGQQSESSLYREVTIKDRIFDEAISLAPEFKAVRIYAHDVTELKKAKDTLRIKEQQLSEAQRVAQIGSWDWDATTDTIVWSDEYYRIFGIDPKLPTPNYIEHLKIYTPESAERLDAAVKKALQTGEPYALSLELADRTFPTRWISARGEAKKDTNDRITGLRGTAQNITASKHAEEALKESEERFVILLEQGFDGIFIHENLVILDLNQRMVDITGYSRSELLQSDVIRLFTPASKDRIHEYIRTGMKGYYGLDLQRKDGKIVHVEAFGTPCKFQGRNVRIVALRDITEQKKLEEQLRQAQKMEAIGHLAGGIAHDFNNILTAIIGYGNLLKNKISADNPLQDYIDQVLASSERASNLTHSLLAFSRKQVINPMPVNINDIIGSLQKILGRIIGEDIQIKVKTAAHDLIVNADRSQIEHVMINLATNARDAMPHGGSLTVTTEEVEIGELFIRMHQCGEVGRYAIVSFSDTGLGMDKDTKEHIFEPFFTTKEVGKGTGLGLAMVYGMIKQHNGFIDVYSEPGEGTTFKIYLPLVKSDLLPEGKTAVTAFSHGIETILLVEDDEAVRKVTKAMLDELGYTVVEARDGRHAVNLFAGNKENIQLVISDIIMPGQSGKDVYDAMKKIRSDVKVLFISGYAPDIIAQKGIIDEGFNFISKPLRLDAFSKKIREVLDR